ncbi:MAG: hypothetical protein AB8G16_14490 [Gammaproteobacteria bacterium]
MDIKPPLIPNSLPVNDTQRLDQTSRQVDSAERTAFENEFNHAATTTPEAVPAPVADAGEARVGQDPWLGEDSSAQRLLLTGLSPQTNLGDVAAQTLPDAVRSAVDFVFTPSS